MSGLYTKAHLPPGVNIITTVPPASCNLNISLLRPHNNHLGKPLLLTLGSKCSAHLLFVFSNKVDRRLLHHQ